MSWIEDNRGLRTRTKKRALAGNRTRVARVASEHSTTEPPVLIIRWLLTDLDYPSRVQRLGEVFVRIRRKEELNQRWFCEKQRILPFELDHGLEKKKKVF